MTDFFDTAYCANCQEPTAHFRLGQRRLECSDCGALRRMSPNQMWEAGTES